MNEPDTAPVRAYDVEPAGVLYRLVLPYSEPPAALTANKRPHWSARSKASREARSDVATLARAAGLTRIVGVRHVTVRLRWAPGDRRRRDPGNLNPFSKALIDGLTPDRTDIRRGPGGVKVTRHIGCGLVPDDTPAWVSERTPVIVPPPERGMWLDVWVQT